MIKVTIRQFAKKNKVYTPAALARKVGVKEAVAGRWWKWKTPDDPIPTLESLDKICAAFDNCDLSELIKRIPDRAKRRGNGNG